MKTGTDIENAVHASMAAQGVGLTTAGWTSSPGTVTITATTMTKSQPILTRGTEIHEADTPRTRWRSRRSMAARRRRSRRLIRRCATDFGAGW